MKNGLVLSGGGAKGAYEIGAWRAFKEFGIKFDAISGASIGAMNAVIMSAFPYWYGVKMWTDVEKNTKYYEDFDAENLTDEDIELMLSCIDDGDQLKALSKKKPLMSNEVVKDTVDYITHSYRLNKIKKDIYCCTVNVIPSMHVEYINLKNIECDEDKRKVIMASMTIPYLFEGISYNDGLYYDGGLMDNSPIRPLLKLNCKIIFVIYLDHSVKESIKKINNTLIVPLFPSRDIGDIKNGTMNFTKTYIKETIRLGYEDTKRFLIQLEHRYKKNKKNYKKY